MLLLVAVFAFTASARSDLPIIGNISDVIGKTRMYLATQETDSRRIVVQAIKKNKMPFEVVGDPNDADFIFEVHELPLLAAGRQHQKRHEAQAYYFREGRRVIACSDTETMDFSGGGTLSRPNEYNLINNFWKAYKKASRSH